MKLLFDENLSPRLVDALASTYPGCRHVDEVGLHGEPDSQIWRYAQQHGYAIVSKDDDFRQLSFMHGAPPKVVWLAVGNAGTQSHCNVACQPPYCDGFVFGRSTRESFHFGLAAPRGDGRDTGAG